MKSGTLLKTVALLRLDMGVSEKILGSLMKLWGSEIGIRLLDTKYDIK